MDQFGTRIAWAIKHRDGRIHRIEADSVLRRFFRTSDVAPFDFILAVSIIDFGPHG